MLLFLGVGGAVGVVGGGIVGQWLYNRRKWSMSVFIGAPCTYEDRRLARRRSPHALHRAALPIGPPSPLLCRCRMCGSASALPLSHAPRHLGCTALLGTPAGGCTVAGTLPMFFLVNADVASMVPLTIVCALLAGGLSGTVGPNMR